MDAPAEVPVWVSPLYDHSVPSPVLIYLHRFGPFGGTAVSEEESWVGLWPSGADAFGTFTGLRDRVVASDVGSTGWLYVLPNGAIDPTNACGDPSIPGQRYWNAFDDCCAFNYMGGSTTGLTPGAPDHVTYINDLIRHLKHEYNVDPDRVYLFGYSSGGFLAHRVACQNGDIDFFAPEAPELIAGIASYAGCSGTSPTECEGVVPVNVLTVHDRGDESVLYAGGLATLAFACWPDYPRFHAGALTTVANWIFHNETDGAGEELDSLSPLDLNVPFSVAQNTRWSHGRLGSIVQHLSGNKGSHEPTLSMVFRTFLIDWYRDHPRPGSGAPKDRACDADLNGDGLVDGADLGIMLGAWGMCP